MTDSARTEVEAAGTTPCGRDCRSCERRGACAAFALDPVPRIRAAAREHADRRR